MTGDHGSDDDPLRVSADAVIRYAAIPDPPTSRGSGADVVRLADIDPRHPGRIAAELRAYWDGLRRGKAIPSRTDVEPQGIRRALDYAFILERIAPGAARFRLAGRHLIDLMGMEVRGMPLCAFFNPASRGRLSDVLETVFQGPQILELTLASGDDYGRPGLQGRMLILPLRSDLGDVTRALGCLIAEGEIGRAPRRFDLDTQTVQPVIPGARTLAPTPGGFAEAAAHWTTPGAAEEAVPAPRRRRPPPPAGAESRPPVPSLGPPDPPPVIVPETPEERRARFRVISAD